MNSQRATATQVRFAKEASVKATGEEPIENDTIIRRGNVVEISIRCDSFIGGEEQ